MVRILSPQRGIGREGYDLNGTFVVGQMTEARALPV
jgi:hypothetical protein